MKSLAKALIITLGVGCSTPLVVSAADYLLFTPGAVEGEPTAPEPGAGVLVQRLTIKKGDTLSRLARKYSGKASYYPQILLFNNIPDPDLIYTGSTILVPVKAGKVGRRVKKAMPAPVLPQAVVKESKAPELPEKTPQQAKRKVTTPGRKASVSAVSAPTPQATVEQALYAKAIGEYKKGHYQQALHAFTRFVALYPDSPLTPDASLYRAECLFNLSNE